MCRLHATQRTTHSVCALCLWIACSACVASLQRGASGVCVWKQQPENPSQHGAALMLIPREPQRSHAHQQERIAAYLGRRNLGLLVHRELAAVLLLHGPDTPALVGGRTADGLGSGVALLHILHPHRKRTDSNIACHTDDHTYDVRTTTSKLKEPSRVSTRLRQRLNSRPGCSPLHPTFHCSVSQCL